MNTALFHAARPGDIGDGRDEGRRREATTIARQMGLKGMAEGMGSQAANIWKMLDDLAVTDKKAYVELTKSGRDEMLKPKGRYFVPVPGFVLKTYLLQPWAPPPPPPSNDLCDEKWVTEGRAAAGTKVFVNICSHECISKPIDQADREIDDTKETNNPAGLRMPMAISQVRETTDHSGARAFAVDAVYHPWVIRCSLGEKRFLHEVGNLTLRWTANDYRGLTLHAKWKKLKVLKYKGGGGAMGSDAVPFPVPPADDAEERNSTTTTNRHQRATTADVHNATTSPPAGGWEGGEPHTAKRQSSKPTFESKVLNDPQSLLAALNKASSDDIVADDEAANSGDTIGAADFNTRGAGDSADGRYEDSGIGKKPGSRGSCWEKPPATSTSVTTNDKFGDPRTRCASPSLDIRLPDSLAGLTTGRRNNTGHNANRGEAHGHARTITTRGPLITEISSPSPREKATSDEEGGSGRVGTRKQGAAERHSNSGGDQGLARKPKKKGGAGAGAGNRQPVVTKGFLNKLGGGGKGKESVTPLYPPTGSENGAEPGGFAKLMGRCKVVDTSSMNKDQIDAAMRAHAGGSKSLNSKAATGSSSLASSSKGKTTAGSRPAVRKGFLESGGGNSLYGEEGSREGGGGLGRKGKNIDREFERLVTEADPDMVNQKSEQKISDPLAEQLAQLATILGPGSSFPGTQRGSSSASGSSSSPSPAESAPSKVKPSTATTNSATETAVKPLVVNGTKSETSNAAVIAPTSTIVDGACSPRGENGANPTNRTKSCTENNPGTGVSGMLEKDRSPTTTSTLTCFAPGDEATPTLTPQCPVTVAIEKVRPPEPVSTNSITQSDTKRCSNSGEKNAVGESNTESKGSTEARGGQNIEAAALPRGVPGGVPGAKRRNSGEEQGGPETVAMDETGGKNLQTTVAASKTTVFAAREASDAKATMIATKDQGSVEVEPGYRMEEIPAAAAAAAAAAMTTDATSGIAAEVGVIPTTRRRLVAAIDLPAMVGGGGSGRREKKSDNSSAFELDVTSRTLDLRVPGLYKLSLQTPFPIDADRATAKFSRKHATLTVSAPEQ